MLSITLETLSSTGDVQMFLEIALHLQTLAFNQWFSWLTPAWTPVPKTPLKSSPNSTQ